MRSKSYLYLVGLYHSDSNVPTKERICSRVFGLFTQNACQEHVDDFRRFAGVVRGTLSLNSDIICIMVNKKDLVVVLGSGYLARFMLSLQRVYSTVLHTSRDPDHHLSWLPSKQRIRFDLARPDSWDNVPSGADLLWSFPAAPPNAVRNFAHTRAFGRLVVLGSTSAYDVGSSVDYPPPWIDESAPIDYGRARVQGEEFLREGCGAIVLRVAGIYGPGRSPYDWIRTGRVTVSRKYVNLIHVEDLAEICLAALRHGVSGEAYNVSDGVPRTWAEIGRTFDGHDCDGAPQGEQPSGKRIDTAKLRSLLEKARVTIRYPNLFVALERMRHEHAAGLDR